jgi:hypothetical protein
MNFINYVMSQKVIKAGRLRWLGQLCRMQDQNPCKKLTLHKTESTRRLEGPAFRWLDSVEEDLKKMVIRSWRRKLQNGDQWTGIIKGAKVHRGL